MKFCRQIKNRIKARWEERSVFRFKKTDTQARAAEQERKTLENRPAPPQKEPIAKERLAERLIEVFGNGAKMARDMGDLLLIVRFLHEVRERHSKMSDEDFEWVKREFYKAIGLKIKDRGQGEGADSPTPGP